MELGEVIELPSDLILPQVKDAVILPEPVEQLEIQKVETDGLLELEVVLPDGQLAATFDFVSTFSTSRLKWQRLSRADGERALGCSRGSPARCGFTMWQSPGMASPGDGISPVVPRARPLQASWHRSTGPVAFLGRPCRLN